MAVIIQLRRGDAAAWSTNNPVLAIGEMGVETDTGKFKVGDGVTDWNTLGYSSGDDGVDGADGSDGATWHSGEGVPAGELGVDGDFYLDSTTGDLYAKDAGSWSVDMNIAGADGADGVYWYSGTGVPDVGTGQDGDYYLDTANGDVYTKDAGSWSVTMNIVGADGADGVLWHVGDGEPGAELGSDGDFYLDNATGDVYEKDTTWSQQINLMGPQGDAGGGVGSRSVTRFDGAVGTVEIDLRESGAFRVTQGEDGLTYELKPTLPKTLLVGWGHPWLSGTGEDYPRFVWEVQ